MSGKDEDQRLSPASARVRRAQGPARAVSRCGEPDVGEKHPPRQTATGSSRAGLPAGGRAGRRLAQAAAEASNLVAGDTNPATDAFVRDLTTGITERASLTASGGQANGASGFTSVSGDERIVAFMSNASNLAGGAPARMRGEWDIYVRDRATGALEWIDDGSSPSVSEDGRYIAYVSGTYGPWPYSWEPGPVVVYDRETDTGIQNIELEVQLYCYPLCWTWVGLEGGEGAPSLAPDAGAVGYVDRDAKVLDLVTRVEHRAAVPPGAPQPDGGSYYPVVAAGQVAFGSYARNLVSGDTNGEMDVFVRRLPLGSSERVSVSTSGQQANGRSFYPGLSADGRYVAFSSDAAKLVAEDANGRTDVFLRDLQTATTTRVSLTAAGGEANGHSGGVKFGVARNAEVIAFGSSATNLVTRDTTGADDVFVRRR